MARTTKTVQHVDDKIVETVCVIEEYPDTIDYGDILDACEIVPDDDHDAPWDDCDGYDHGVERARNLDGDVEAMRGYAWHQGDRERVVIVLTDDFKADYRHYRDHGCSKQVAREMVALSKRNRLDMLVNWYENGYEYWGVTCDFMGREASVWGIDSDDYAEKEVKHEIASEVASQLEGDGFKIINRPDRRKAYLANRRHHLKMNLRMDCWTD